MASMLRSHDLGPLTGAPKRSKRRAGLQQRPASTTRAQARTSRSRVHGRRLLVRAVMCCTASQSCSELPLALSHTHAHPSQAGESHVSLPKTVAAGAAATLLLLSSAPSADALTVSPRDRQGLHAARGRARAGSPRAQCVPHKRAPFMRLFAASMRGQHFCSAAAARRLTLAPGAVD